jgi:hypothetical protein
LFKHADTARRHAKEKGRLYLARGSCTALGECPHFAGHDREPAPLLAGPRSLDRGVQRQDVGLEGDAVRCAVAPSPAAGRRRWPRV